MRLFWARRRMFRTLLAALRMFHNLVARRLCSRPPPAPICAGCTCAAEGSGPANASAGCSTGEIDLSGIELAHFTRLGRSTRASRRNLGTSRSPPCLVWRPLWMGASIGESYPLTPTSDVPSSTGPAQVREGPSVVRVCGDALRR